MPKPVYEEDVTVLWNQAGHTLRDVTANRPDIILKEKREYIYTDRCGGTRRQKCRAKGSGKDFKIQEFRYTTYVEPVMYDYNWKH
jgi:hypothetical protein